MRFAFTLSARLIGVSKSFIVISGFYSPHNEDSYAYTYPKCPHYFTPWVSRTARSNVIILCPTTSLLLARKSARGFASFLCQGQRTFVASPSDTPTQSSLAVSGDPVLVVSTSNEIDGPNCFKSSTFVVTS